MNRWILAITLLVGLLVGSLLKQGNAQPAEKIRTYEYRVELMDMVNNGKKRAEVYQQKLNELGNEGWKLTHYDNNVTFYFVREK